MADPQKSKALREQGNDLYRAREFKKAIVVYHEAAVLDPTDFRPSSNLSAAYYEIGQYAESIEQSHRALDLAGSQDVMPETKAAALRLRILKSNRHLPSNEKNGTKAHRTSAIPRYRPSMFENFDYYVVGNEIPASISDEELFKTRADQGTASGIQDYLFAGVGDMRNLFATLKKISKTELKDTKAGYRFLIIDVKPAIIARNVLIAALVQGLTKYRQSSEIMCCDVLNTLFFLYTSRLVPKHTLTRIQHLITLVLKRLEAGHQRVAWLQLRQEDIPVITQCLRGWLEKAASIITPSEMVQRLHKELRLHHGPRPGSNATEEQRVYYESGFLYPAKPVLQVQPKLLRELVRDKMDGNVPAQYEKIRELVGEHWAVNPIMIDLDLFTKGWRWVDSPENIAKKMEVCDNPFSVAEDLFNLEDHSEAGWILDRNPTAQVIVGAFFWSISRALLQLKGRFMVHCAVGDYADVLEQSRDLTPTVPQKGSPGGLSQLEVRPKLFDRMHFSNAPDYAGGHFTLFVVASAMLKQHDAAWMTLNTIRNATLWANNAHLLAEYVLTDRPRSMKELFNIRLINVGENPKIPVAGYARYGNHAEGLTYENLLPRRGLTRWLHCHFFKLSVPALAEPATLDYVYAPLNLTNFFRLLKRLRVLGYPAHWLSEILGEIFSGTIVSEARPPLTSPVAVTEWQRQHPAQEWSTEKFLPEMRTLYPIFQPSLNFCLQDSGLPCADDLVRCTFSMPSYYYGGVAESNVLALVFWPKRYSPYPCVLGDPEQIRRILDLPAEELKILIASMSRGPPCVYGDKCGMTLAFAKEFSVWSTFEWKAVSKTGTVVMEQSYYKKLVDEEWFCGLWRCDTWDAVMTESMTVKEAFTGTQRWVDFVDGEQSHELEIKMAASSIA